MYNLNENPQGPQLNAEMVMDTCMTELWDICIDPIKEEMTEEQQTLIGMIGITLKLIAQKAKCYEEMLENGHGPNYGGDTDFSRN